MKKGYKFKTNSDTEVIVALYSELKQKVVQKLRGMFSFVIWNKEDKVLFGARDPFGIKPFFYAKQDDTLYFASEKKSIFEYLSRELDTEALQHYLSFQYVPEPKTMMLNIKRLEPGTFFYKQPTKKLTIQTYWQPWFQPVYSSEQAASKKIYDVLLDSVSLHMRSDVPVGSFLSGGIDSSLIVSLAKEINPNIKTFSVGFEQEGYSEIDIAKQTADALDVENYSYIITPEEYINELPKIMWHADVPIADPAAIPLYFVAREASKQVKVALSGEGADELFGGYNIYREPDSLKVFSYLPTFIKKFLSNISTWMPDGVKGKSFIERGITPLEERYIGNAKIFEEEEKQAILHQYQGDIHYRNETKRFYKQSRYYDAVTRMQHLDIQTWLKGDILLKADKMTMAHSLELRVPFLDKEVFAVASKLGKEQKINKNTTKYMLRKAAEKIVPHHVVHRKKLGFPVPIAQWLKNELYDWTVALIQTSETDYLINKQFVLNLLDDHVRNKKDNSRKIWTILAFMVWHQVYIENKYDFKTPHIEKRKANII